MFFFPRYRAPPGQMPPFRVAKWHADITYFHPDRKYINIFARDGIRSSKLGFLNLGTTLACDWLKEVQQYTLAFTLPKMPVASLVVMIKNISPSFFLPYTLWEPLL